MSTSTTETLTLENGTLTLVTLSPEFFASGLESSGMRTNPHATNDERTFYAVPSRDMGPGWGLVVLPETDPRSGGMWLLDPAGYDLTDTLDTSATFRGWNIEQHYMTPVSPVATPVRPRIEHDATAREALPITEAYPLGSVWNHISAGDATVVSHTAVSGPRYVVVRSHDDAGRERDWVRGALDLSSTTFVRWADETSQESTEAPESAVETVAASFTQADIDRAVETALARDRARVEAWKEEANATAVRYAKQNGLCGEFENCMDEIGLMGREEWDEAHTTTVTVRFTVDVDVDVPESDNSDHAVSEARDILYNELPYPMDGTIQFDSIQ